MFSHIVDEQAFVEYHTTKRLPGLWLAEAERRVVDRPGCPPEWQAE